MTKEKWLECNWYILKLYECWDVIEIEEFSKYHVRITRVADGRSMDFWTTTNKGQWNGFENARVFKIPCLDQYLEKMFLNYKPTLKWAEKTKR